MKKFLLFVAVAMLLAPAASFAQEIWYEGEVNVGYALDGSYSGDLSGSAKYSRIFVETVHGVRITDYAFVGGGIGLQYNTEKEQKIMALPIFANLKGIYPVSENFAPYVSVDLGYGACVNSEIDDLKGGLYASYGAGLNWKKLNFGLGMQHQGFKLGAAKFSINSFFLKVGYKF